MSLDTPPALVLPKAISCDHNGFTYRLDELFTFVSFAKYHSYGELTRTVQELADKNGDHDTVSLVRKRARMNEIFRASTTARKLVDGIKSSGADTVTLLHEIKDMSSLSRFAITKYTETVPSP